MTATPRVDHRAPIRAAAVGVGLFLALLPATASANKMDYSGLGDVLALFVLGPFLSLVFSVGSLITAAVLGRRGARRATWKRAVATIIIVVASVGLLITVTGVGLTLWLGLGLASRGETLLVVGLSGALFALPATAALFAIRRSIRLYRENASDFQAEGSVMPPRPEQRSWVRLLAPALGLILALLLVIIWVYHADFGPIAPFLFLVITPPFLFAILRLARRDWRNASNFQAGGSATATRPALRAPVLLIAAVLWLILSLFLSVVWSFRENYSSYDVFDFLLFGSLLKLVFSVGSAVTASKLSRRDAAQVDWKRQMAVVLLFAASAGLVINLAALVVNIQHTYLSTLSSTLASVPLFLAISCIPITAAVVAILRSIRLGRQTSR
jgi:hypothetical protein